MSGALSPRARIVLITLVVFLALDVARSAVARGRASDGTGSPSDTSIAWPPGSAASPDDTLGDSVLARDCAVCHGPEGLGDGPAAPAMLPRPSDLTTGQTKYRSTAPGQPPTRDALASVVTDGLVASGMPYLGDVLSDEEVEAVVDLMIEMSPDGDGAEPEPIAVPARPEADAASLARGRALYLNAGCAGCHGDDGRTWLTFTDARGYPVGARDLTAPWTFRGGAEPSDVWLRLTTGLLPSPMPAHATRLTADETWDIVNYLEAQYRTAPWTPGGELGGSGSDPDPYRRGEYLVRSGACGMCHTPVDTDGAYHVEDALLAGATGLHVDGEDAIASGNLTPHELAGLGTWTENDIARAVRQGEAPSRSLNGTAMPSAYFQTFTDDDVLAVAKHLHTLPPVDPTALGGDPGGGLLARALFAAQVAVLLFGVVALLAEDRRAGARGRRGRDRWWTAVAITGLLAAAVFVWLLPRPDDGDDSGNAALLAAEAQAVPLVETLLDETHSAEQIALAKRGRYLYLVSACGMCHGPDASGGRKLSSRRDFGTVWASNITPDLDTGVGEWTDEELARAIRAGVSRDGRAMHWRAMPWDYLSNLDEEDVRALAWFLRALPPVRQQVPEPRPPAADDCPELTLFLEEGDDPGCR